MDFKLVTVIVIFSVLGTTVLCQFEDQFRLSKDTFPIHYNIWLNVSLETNIFNGEVEIQIGVRTATNKITVRQYDITITKIELYEIIENGRVNIPVTKDIRFIEHTLPLSTTAGNYLEVGREYSLQFTYTSKSVNLASGMFRSINTNPITGEKTTMIATNFLPQYASSVFPCYDDPGFKATFGLTIQHAVGFEAISNMEILNTETLDEIVTTTFKPTPLLPAHSIAFSVLNYRQECDNNRLKICGYYDDQHNVDDIKLVLQTARAALTELEDFLGVGLGLLKLDIIPVESSTPMIGNYGLLFNRPNSYYYNPESSSAAHKDRVIRHTIRQVVNLYFFNYVTPEWWDDIWISDGLSLILEYTIANMLYPETDAVNEFFNSLYEYATDRIVYLGPGLLNIQAINSMLNNKYQYRAAAIMNMVQNIVGDNIFKTGLKELLSLNSTSITSETFFKTFESLGFKNDLNTIMNTWIKQDSYPILNVTRNYETNAIILTQDNVLNVYDNYMSRTNLFWMPLNSIQKRDDASKWLETTPTDWLEYTKTREILSNAESLDNAEWIIYNKQLSGFFHINYDEHNWNLLATQLDSDFSEIPWITRTQLLHDSILFALNGKLKLDVIFRIANYTRQEEEFAPWLRFISGFNDLDAMIFGTSVYSNFTKFTLHKIEHLYERVRIIDLNENSDLSIKENKLRKPVIDLACHMGLEQCMVDTNTLLKKLVDQTDGIEILLQHESSNIILYNGMALAEIELFRKILAKQDLIELNDFAEALGHVQNQDVIDELLAVLITENGEKIGGVEINLTANERRLIFEKLINYNLVALDKSLTFALEKSDLIKDLWFFNSNKYSIPNSFLNVIKTTERLQKFFEIDNIYQGDRSTSGTANVAHVNEKILEFQETLAKFVEQIDNEGDGGDGGDGGNAGGGGEGGDDGAITIAVPSLLLAVMALLVNLYQ